MSTHNFIANSILLLIVNKCKSDEADSGVLKDGMDTTSASSQASSNRFGRVLHHMAEGSMDSIDDRILAWTQSMKKMKKNNCFGLASEMKQTAVKLYKDVFQQKFRGTLAKTLPCTAGMDSLQAKQISLTSLILNKTSLKDESGTLDAVWAIEKLVSQTNEVEKKTMIPVSDVNKHQQVMNWLYQIEV